MSREYPDWISPERAAEGKRVFGGFVVAFRRDIDKRVIVDLQVEAALPLICQASLEVYDELVKRRSELVVIEHDHEQDARGQDKWPESYEPVRSENGRLAVASLVEEELLLGLPQIPRKPGMDKVEYSTGGEVPESTNPQQKGTKNPFAALQNMLERDGQD